MFRVNYIRESNIKKIVHNNGNILKQRKFIFTLKNAIDIEELDSEDKVYIYDGDKLLAFNAKSVLITKRRTYKPNTVVKHLVGQIDVFRVITAYNSVMTGKAEELRKTVFHIRTIAKVDC